MCVVNLKKRVKGPVVAWKLLERVGEGFEGIRGFYYSVNKTYTSKPPGFQAFVNRKDALKSRVEWPSLVVMKVRLYDAREGVIEKMDPVSNLKPGWTASKIRIPSLCVKKEKKK